jgi:hypothetical protein
VRDADTGQETAHTDREAFGSIIHLGLQPT